MFSNVEIKELRRYDAEFGYADIFENKCFLVTGATGMIGTGIIKWLLYLNKVHGTHLKIYASSRNPDKARQLLGESDCLEFVTFGHETDIPCAAPLDFIIHTAAPTDKLYYVNNPVETFRTIVDGTGRILELAKEKKSSVVFLSSIEVYASPISEIAIREDYVGPIDSLAIRSSYPLGKKAAEYLCFAYSEEYDVDVRIARLSSVQGLYQPYNDSKIYSELLRCIVERKNMIMKSDGSTTKSIVYTLDAISGLFCLLIKGKKGEAYNITNPETVMSMKALTEYLFDKYSDSCKLVFDIDKSNQSFLPTMACVQDISKITSLGWKYLTSLDHLYEIDMERFRERI